MIDDNNDKSYSQVSQTDTDKPHPLKGNPNIEIENNYYRSQTPHNQTYQTHSAPQPPYVHGQIPASSNTSININFPMYMHPYHPIGYSQQPSFGSPPPHY